jgi:hypothetical protein
MNGRLAVYFYKLNQHVFPLKKENPGNIPLADYRDRNVIHCLELQ